MELVALDLEGSGAQDRDQEAILEIALVPIRDWNPDLADAFHTWSTGRPIPRQPWISAGLTGTALRQAPRLAAIELELVSRINGRHLVGHNVGVDWRLLHRRCPAISPSGLIDTLRLARSLPQARSNGLGALATAYRLTERINQFAPASTPHRALWDTVAAALLLPVLLSEALGRRPTPDDLVAHVQPLTTRSSGHAEFASQPSLFD